MAEFIARYGVFSGIGVAAISAGVAAIKHVRRKHSARANLPPPFLSHILELAPLYFEVSLNTQISEVCIYVRAINYTRREIALSEVTASYFHVNRGPPLENLPAGEYRIPPRHSVELMCRRTLTDAEARVFASVPWSYSFDGRLSLRARGSVWWTRVAVDRHGLAIKGWINGLPSQPRG